MASVMSAVTAMRGSRPINFIGTRGRQRGTEFVPREGMRGGPEGGGGGAPDSSALGLEAGDLVEESTELGLVDRPDLLLGNLAEGLDVALHDRHALGLEQLLGALEIVDRFDQVAHLALSLAAHVQEQLLLC